MATYCLLATELEEKRTEMTYAIVFMEYVFPMLNGHLDSLLITLCKVNDR